MAENEQNPSMVTPTAAPQRRAREFPLQTMRDFLVPDTLLDVKTFEGGSLENLDSQINKWVDDTKAMIAMPGPVSRHINEITQEVVYTISLSYVPVVR